jgi:hypothetical protein
MPTATLSPTEAKALAQEAYIFGMPVVYISVQIDLSTHVTKAGGGKAPLNQLAHYRKLPDASNKEIVGMNFDVLLSLAWFDLAEEPLVLTIPDIKDRFWIVQLLNAWNDVSYAPGARTQGGKGGDFLIAGPDWQGETPPGVTLYWMPTNIGAVGGRIRINGPEEEAAINALQDQFRLVPLSAWGKKWTPPEVPLKAGVDGKTPVPRQILAMPPQEFFSRLNALMVDNPPYAADAPTLARIAKLGIAPGATFAWDSFSPEIQDAISEGVKAAQKQILATPLGDDVNGWQLTFTMGRMGTNYPLRAAWCFFGVGGNLVEDACYPMTRVDSEGKAFEGSQRYQLHFSADNLPPVNYFWALYLYDNEFFVVDNPLNRYRLGDSDPLTYGKDGSLILYLQNESPGKDKEANWLPIPAEGGFLVAMRLYGPKSEVVNGTWQPPAIHRVG